MEFDILMQHINLTKTSKIGLMEKATNTLINDEEADDTLLRLEELAEVALSNEKWIGNADDYHNFAVTYARLDQEDRACQILEKGINTFSNNVDLLADYIQYGIVCAEFEKCNQYYDKLLSIPKERWNWRAFTFSIDYILATLEFSDITLKNYLSIKENAMEIAKEFQQYWPNNEQCYASEYDIHTAFNDRKNAEKCLVNALTTLSVAPKCALRLADMSFEKGEYESTLKYLKRCEIDAIKPQSGIDMGYLYLLMTLSEIALLYKCNEFKFQNEDSNEKVKEIYKLSSVAKDLLKNKISMKKSLNDIIKIVEAKTGIDYYEE